MWPLVLDVAWRVDATRDCPAPGGEPLWRVADGPAIVVSALNPTKKCRNRRLPGLAQCNDFICGSESFTPGRKAANRWIIPGSRLFLHVSAGLVLRRNSRGWKGYAPKRLPSRRWAIACRIDVPRHYRGRERGRLRFHTQGPARRAYRRCE